MITPIHRLRSSFTRFTILVVLTTATLHGAEKLKGLMIDGQNNHDWVATTPVLMRILEDSGRFTVDVTTSPPAGPVMPSKPKDATPEQEMAHTTAIAVWKTSRDKFKKSNQPAWDTWRPRFADYDVLVMNYNGDRWPDPVRADFIRYIEGGGGLVVYHAANNTFPDWPEFNEMIGVGGWGGRNDKSGPMLRWRDGTIARDDSPSPAGTHGPPQPYVVEIRDAEHPITQGLPSRWLHCADELYSKLRGPARNLTVLATAYADPANKGTGEHEPILMTITYGKGRVFHDVLGHGPKNMTDAGFVITFQRGAEWAATGAVTLPLPSPDLMSDTEVVVHPLMRGRKN